MPPTTALDLYRAGQLDEAIQALVARLRDDPANVRERTFLFELLCFAGDLDRAEKHLDAVSRSGHDAEMGALLYRSALHAERTRREMFLADGVQGATGPATVAGTLNGQPFTTIADADPRIGGRLEVFAAGQYTWVPFEHIASIRIEAPSQLRDLLWARARVQAGPKFRDFEFGEVLLPVLTPFAWQAADADVRLGRVTDWEALADGSDDAPVGQKLLDIDGDLVPILEVRELIITPQTQD